MIMNKLGDNVLNLYKVIIVIENKLAVGLLSGRVREILFL